MVHKIKAIPHLTQPMLGYYTNCINKQLLLWHDLAYQGVQEFQKDCSLTFSYFVPGEILPFGPKGKSTQDRRWNAELPSATLDP